VPAAGEPVDESFRHNRVMGGQAGGRIVRIVGEFDRVLSAKLAGLFKSLKSKDL